jgi:hypothetical protein
MENKILSIIERNYKSLNNISNYEKLILQKIIHCRTEPVDGLYMQCDECFTFHPVYKSCKNRMCPVCNGSASLKWTAHREAELLNTGYFLLTFTVPSELRSLFLLNKKICYTMLFKAMHESLSEGIHSNERYFHGRGGYFAILHTWDQLLNYHPHVHVVVPGGCLSKDGTEWMSSHPRFFLPVKRLSDLFKKKLLLMIKKELKKGALRIPPEIGDAQKYYEKLRSRKWVVHCEAPEKERSNPEKIIRYLSRYVSKTAVNDNRILKVEKGKVYLKYYNRKKKKAMVEVIPELQFLKRLLLHILPKGFQKVRYYGFMANRYRASQLALCRMLLGDSLNFQHEIDKEQLNDVVFLFWKYFGIDISLCKDCGKGHVHLKDERMRSG